MSALAKYGLDVPESLDLPPSERVSMDGGNVEAFQDGESNSQAQWSKPLCFNFNYENGPFSHLANQGASLAYPGAG